MDIPNFSALVASKVIEKIMFWDRNEVKIMNFSGDVCIVVHTQATLTLFHHTIEERNNSEKKKKAEPN